MDYQEAFDYLSEAIEKRKAAGKKINAQHEILLVKGVHKFMEEYDYISKGIINQIIGLLEKQFNL